MYSRSAKGGEKGDPNRNPWLAKMLYLGINSKKSMKKIPAFYRLGRNQRQSF
jgi:hypothetical protein